MNINKLGLKLGKNKNNIVTQNIIKNKDFQIEKFDPTKCPPRNETSPLKLHRTTLESISEQTESDNQSTETEIHLDQQTKNSLLQEYYSRETHSSTLSQKFKEGLFSCTLCNNDTDEEFCILSCKHFFHINCLAEFQLEQLKLSQDSLQDFLSNQTCPICNTPISKNQLLYIHNTYNDKLNHNLKTIDQEILIQEENIKTQQLQITANYDYKNKINKLQEYSKQIKASILGSLN